MLVNLKTVLSLAEAGGYAIPAFNVYNMETAMGAVKAAEAECHLALPRNASITFVE